MKCVSILPSWLATNEKFFHTQIPFGRFKFIPPGSILTLLHKILRSQVFALASTVKKGISDANLCSLWSNCCHQQQVLSWANYSSHIIALFWYKYVLLNPYTRNIYWPKDSRPSPDHPYNSRNLWLFVIFRLHFIITMIFSRTTLLVIATLCNTGVNAFSPASPSSTSAVSYTHLTLPTICSV